MKTRQAVFCKQPFGSPPPATPEIKHAEDLINGFETEGHDENGKAKWSTMMPEAEVDEEVWVSQAVRYHETQSFSVWLAPYKIRHHREQEAA